MIVTINLDLNSNTKNGHPIFLNIFVSKTDRLYPRTKLYSFAEHWDFENERPKKTHPQYSSIIDKIIDYKFKINKLQMSGVKRNANQIKNYLFGNDGDVYAFWEQRIKEEKKKLENSSKPIKTGGNASVYQFNLNVWKEYKSSLSFNEITYDFITKFKLEKSSTCTAGGINTYITKLKAIYNEAVRRGVYMSEGNYPFVKVMEKQKPTKDKHLTISEMKMIIENPSSSIYYKYFLLCFYLGGLDFIDLASLKKSDIKFGRIKKMRSKGNTREIINNKIFPEAQKIMDFFEDPESEYVLPIHKFSYVNYRHNYTNRIQKIISDMNIYSYVDSKTPRYSFIHIGSMELYQNRDIIKELVGHAQRDTLSIYEGKFPLHIKDEVHRKIIDAVIEINNKLPEDSEFTDLA
ncbi:tyrosine-type recombinase/integrase [Chryseobacterium sp. 2R14A]|uniref:tyrosine-type recombinase/integrase n=1 Tax=Chryseobacterium sp. 2R14A TaxID=3380353 RepID=UPI003CF44632